MERSPLPDAARLAVRTGPAASARVALPVLVLALSLLLPAMPAQSRERLLFEQTSLPDPDVAPPPREGARSDTIDFGFYEIRADGQPYAVRGGLWTFDHGAADPLEGWSSADLMENRGDFWRRMTDSTWTAEGNPPPWPRLNASEGIALCGLSKPAADTLAWAAGIGYGNDRCQRLTSPAFLYDGTGEIELSFRYFNQTEPGADYSKVYLVVGEVRTILNPPGFTGSIGIDDFGAIAPTTYTRAITGSELGGGVDPRAFRIVVEFRSDGLVSDEDGGGGWDCFYGPIGLDDLIVDGANLDPPVARTFDFEASLQGWIASHCPGAGCFLGIAPLAQYAIQDPCDCRLFGQVLELHDDTFRHPGDEAPVYQHERAISCAAHRRGDIGDPGYLEFNRILAEWDMYAEMPMGNGVFYRPGWSHYPCENPNVPGLQQWSPRVGRPTYSCLGVDPLCFRATDIGTDWGLPPDCEQVKFLIDLASTCEGFGIPPGACTGMTNFSPLFDNFRIRNLKAPHAPAITFEVGGRYTDGFGASTTFLSPTDPGYANIVFDTRMGNPNAPAKQGDSLVIKGPLPAAATKWESKLWLRVKRKGPGQSGNALYDTWRNAFVAAKGIDFDTGANPPFTWGYMDSIEVGAQVSRNKFCSQFRDGPSSGGGNLPKDLMFNWGGGGEHEEGNEILPDLALTPGTKIEYFVTSNYICEPTIYFYLPDTLGGQFEEFEILPSYRQDGPYARFPCLLYVDASARALDQRYIEAGLWKVYSGSSGPIADPAPWDRYDYLDAASSWEAPLYREPQGNSGASLLQLLGYKTILFDVGTLDLGATSPRDWEGVQSWLTSPLFGSNNRIQGLYLSGSSIARIIAGVQPSFLSTYLGARVECPSYNQEECPPGELTNDENYCVRLEPGAEAVAPFAIPADIYGNRCPGMIDFTVLGTVGSGSGNLFYRRVDAPDSAAYAQVAFDGLNTESRYRSILSGFDLGHLPTRDLEQPGPSAECQHDSARAVTAIADHLGSALGWLLCREFAGYPLCGTPSGWWSWESGATEAKRETPVAFVNRLERNRPNPFGGSTLVRFSLAQAGPARLVIYDVGGRRIRVLHDGALEVGPHEWIWDGRDDRGRAVASGVY